MSFWKMKWGYKHSLLIVLSLVLNGFILELFTVDRGMVAPMFPYGIILLGFMIVLCGLINYVSFFQKVRGWLISKPFVITLITSISVLIMASGYIPQQVFPQYPLMQKLGLFHITSSVPFVFLVVLLMASLIIAIFNRITPFSLKNSAFLLNHIGILTVFVGGIFGSGDLQKVKMYLKKDKAVWEGHITEKPSVKVEMPFALKLNEFILEEYSPDLVVVDKENKIIQKCGVLSIKDLGELCKFNNFSIELIKFIPDGFKVENRFVSVNHVGTSPVAQIKVLNQQRNLVKQGNVVQGSNLQDSEYLEIDSNFKLAIPIAKPKNFKSIGRFYTPEEEIGSFQLEVNNPFELKGWKLYQFGYNDKMGKWSDLSIVEAVRDPWLPVIYIGAFLMIAGALFLIFPSRKILEQSDE